MAVGGRRCTKVLKYIIGVLLLLLFYGVLCVCLCDGVFVAGRVSDGFLSLLLLLLGGGLFVCFVVVGGGGCLFVCFLRVWWFSSSSSFFSFFLFSCFVCVGITLPSVNLPVCHPVRESNFVRTISPEPLNHF